VSRNFIPRSSISTVDASILTVFLIFSFADGIALSGYKSVRNKLFISVDFPRPDSPIL
jgi:hypothetical protein